MEAEEKKRKSMQMDGSLFNNMKKQSLIIDLPLLDEKLKKKGKSKTNEKKKSKELNKEDQLKKELIDEIDRLESRSKSKERESIGKKKVNKEEYDGLRDDEDESESLEEVIRKAKHNNQ